MSVEIELAWTGERVVPSHLGDTAIEHLHRYAFAAEFVRGKHVLDVACGEGYGSHLLSASAASVTGVDLSSEAIEHARRKYGDKATFILGNCLDIPITDASVDVVVSFETLEHIGDHDGMIAEIRRVLRPGGTLIISSPDSLYYSIIPRIQNQYHVKELSRDEFRRLIEANFRTCHFFEQKIFHGSVVAPTLGLPVAGIRNYIGDFMRTAHTEGITAAPYNIAVATDGNIDFPDLLSLFEGWNIPTEMEKLLSEARSAHSSAVAELGGQLEASDAALAALKLTQNATEIAHEAAIAELKRQITESRAAHAEVLEQLNDTKKGLVADVGDLRSTQDESTKVFSSMTAELREHLTAISAHLTRQHDFQTTQAAFNSDLWRQITESEDPRSAHNESTRVLSLLAAEFREHLTGISARLTQEADVLKVSLDAVGEANTRLEALLTNGLRSVNHESTKVFSSIAADLRQHFAEAQSRLEASLTKIAEAKSVAPP